MKNLVLFVLLLCSISYGQVTVSATLDAANLTKGSAPTEYESALNYMVTVNSVTDYREIGLYFEQFKRIYFVNYGIRFSYRVVDFEEVSIFSQRYTRESFHTLLGVQGGQIIRHHPDKPTLSYLNYGGIFETRYFYDDIGITFQYTVVRRTDQQYWGADSTWIGSLFVGLVYKFS